MKNNLIKKIIKEIINEDAATDLLDLDDVETATDLLDLDDVEKSIPIDMIRHDMSTNNNWYLNKKRIEGRKYLALGRSTYYRDFIKTLRRNLNQKIYQSDFMEWLYPGDHYKSLLFYITTAEKIFLSLKGISKEELEKATIKSSDNTRFTYMTTWEINQIWKSEEYLSKTWWYVYETTEEEAFFILKDKVNRNQIKKGI